jgi:exonuclease VII large subunit
MSSGQILHERARSLLTLIDGLQIENDLSSARRTLDDWRTEMFSLINNIHLSTTNKLDSLTGRLHQLKQRRSETLRQDILPNLNKMVIERRKNLSEQELNEIKKKITKIETDLQVFGRLLTKISSDEKKLVGQIDILKSRKNVQSFFYSLFYFHRHST